MLVIETKEDLKKYLGPLWRAEEKIGFVPTMGALHEGHATLLRASKSRCSHTVLSIFVNPTQFGPNEDFNVYPRTLEADLELARNLGVDFVYAPSVATMYAQNCTTSVDPGEIAKPLCGKYRPGHFNGVATVVTKLFAQVRPTHAFFGQKDLQQCLVIKRIARDLDFPVEICIEETVREQDGLAMSSRNRYLTKEQRAKAVVLYQALKYAQSLSEAGELNPEKILSEARAYIEAAHDFNLQYLELLSYPDLNPVEKLAGTVAIAVAAYLGDTRLIDNVVLNCAPSNVLS